MIRSRSRVLLGLLLVVGLGVGCGARQGSGGDEPQIQNAELQVGDEAPDFRLADHTGGYVRLSNFEGEKNVVVAFYPLAWTPVWSEEIPAFDADKERFEAVDTQVLGISVDGTATNAAWAESLGIEWVLLLSDFWPHGEVAQQYGVMRPQGFAERATFIVDKEGIIRYARIYDIDELPENEPLFDVLVKMNQ